MCGPASGLCAINGAARALACVRACRTRAHVSGTLQNYARKHQLAIDTISFSYTYLKKTPGELTAKPEAGCYIFGLYLEGARWDETTGCLNDSRQKQLYTELPPIHLAPVQHRKKPTSGVYRSPVYKVRVVRGVSVRVCNFGCVRACVRACVRGRACVCARECVICVCVCVTSWTRRAS